MEKWSGSTALWGWEGAAASRWVAMWQRLYHRDVFPDHSLPSGGRRAFPGRSTPFPARIPCRIPRGAAVLLRPVREAVHAAERAAAAPPHPHRREALHVQRLRQDLHRQIHAAPPHLGTIPERPERLPGAGTPWSHVPRADGSGLDGTSSSDGSWG